MSNADAIIALFSDLYAEHYCLTASAALFIYDVIVTFDREVACFWSTKASGAALLFFANKYLTVITIVLSMLAFNGSIFTNKTCATFQQAGDVFVALQMVPSGVFSALRAYVLSKSKLLGLLTFILSIAPTVANLVPYAYHFSGEIIPPLGCLYVDSMTTVLNLRLVVISRAMVIAADILVIYITWTSLCSGDLRRNIHESRAMSLPSIFLRNGMIYFAMFGIVNILLLLSSLVSSGAIHNSTFPYLTIFLTPIMAILISRFLLQLQESSQATLRVHSEDPLHISINYYDETPSFVRSLGSVITPNLPVHDEELASALRSRSRTSGDIEGSSYV